MAGHAHQERRLKKINRSDSKVFYVAIFSLIMALSANQVSAGEVTVLHAISHVSVEYQNRERAKRDSRRCEGKVIPQRLYKLNVSGEKE